MDVHGELNLFNNNDPGSGAGALYVTSLGQIRLIPGAAVNFIGNIGG